MMKVQVIIAAAGSGERMGGDISKPFVMLCGRPLVVHTLSVFEECDAVHSIIVAAHPDYCDRMRAVIADAGLAKVSSVIAGGDTRGQSVFNALKALDEDTGRVLIHDGARPCITLNFVAGMIQTAVQDEALVAGVPVKPTIKRADPVSLAVRETIPRDGLWEIQTPQIFEPDLLRQAYRQKEHEATDDAALVERLGWDVRIFPGLEENIKVTTPHDLFVAEKILEERNQRRG